MAAKSDHPAHKTEATTTPAPAPAARTFKVGDEVSHPQYGLCKVTGVKSDGATTICSCLSCDGKHAFDCCCTELKAAGDSRTPEEKADRAKRAEAVRKAYAESKAKARAAKR